MPDITTKPFNEKTSAGEQESAFQPEQAGMPETTPSTEAQLTSKATQDQKDDLGPPPELISDTPAPTSAADDTSSLTAEPEPATEKEAQEGSVADARTWERVFVFFKRRLRSLLKKQ